MITEISLSNFKGFKRTSIPIGGLTLLSGLNGSGKSTVIQACGLLRQSYDAGFLSRGEILLNGELVDLGTGADVLFNEFEQARVGIGISGFQDDTPFHLDWSTAIETADDVLSCDRSPSGNSMPAIGLFEPGFQFLRADRITPSTTFPKSQNAVRHNRSLGPQGEFTPHYLLEFGADPVSEDMPSHPADPEARSILGQLNAWLQEFSPGARVEVHSVPMTGLVRLAFAFRGEGAAYGAAHRPTNVGFGLTHVLPVLTACLGAKPGQLLMIENPEAQLHPRGQVAIGRLLALTAACGVQVVVESHSDHILNGIRLTVKNGKLSSGGVKFHFFTRGVDGAMFESPEIYSDGRLSNWPIGFFDEWERSLDELME